MTTTNDEAAFWNEEGGEQWVANIERLETMLSRLSARLLAGAAPKTAEQVLDIGCGGGITSSALANAVGPTGAVIGADISAVILKVARQRYAQMSNLEFVTADAGIYEFEPDRFDLITSRFGVMFFPDPHAAFENLHRAGKAGGRMVFICWRALQDNPWMGEPVGAAFTVLTPPEKRDPYAPGPFSLSQPDRVKDVMSSAGFSDVTLTAVDEPVNLGDLEPAVNFLTKMGPAAEPLREAPADQREQAIGAMRAALAKHDTAEGVMMQGGVWLVEATIR